MALSPLIEQPLMTDGRNSLGVCIHTCVGASFFGLLHVAGGRGPPDATASMPAKGVPPSYNEIITWWFRSRPLDQTPAKSTHRVIQGKYIFLRIVFRDLNDFSQIKDLTPPDWTFSRMDAQWEITLGIDHQGIAQVIEIIKVTGVVALAIYMVWHPTTIII